MTIAQLKRANPEAIRRLAAWLGVVGRVDLVYQVFYRL